MNSGFYEAILIGIVGIVIIISVIRFTRLFYKNPSRSIQLIRLSKNTNITFIILMSMNFVFVIGYLFQIIYIKSDYDLIAILIYAIFTALFFLVLSRILSGKAAIK